MDPAALVQVQDAAPARRRGEGPGQTVASGRVTEVVAAGQSPKACADGDGPGAAPATALPRVGLPRTVVAGAGDGPALGQQMIWQNLPARVCFQNSNTNLLCATCRPGPGEMVGNDSKSPGPSRAHSLEQWFSAGVTG